MNGDVFRTIKSSANGMLPAEAYEMLFDLGRHSGCGTCIEIGTIHGAGCLGSIFENLQLFTRGK
jgi:hypothetical protein